jgi:hypothetical protein
MKRISITGLCLVVVLAMSAIAASGASAAPTYKSCVKVAKGTGHFTSKTCEGAPTTGGKYELASPAGAKYTSKSKSATLETPGVGSVTCKKSAGAGEFTGETTGTTTVTFASCETAGKKCHSAGEGSGTIKTFLLDTTLVEGAHGPEALVAGTEGAEKLSAEFECEGITIRTKGATGGIITGNIGKAEKGATQSFSESSAQELESEVVGLTPYLHSVEKVVASTKGATPIGVF